MKGTIFTAFESFVEETWSLATADEAFSASDLSTAGAYSNVGNYPHSDFLKMAVIVSKRTKSPLPQLVRDFGDYLFDHLAATHPDIIKNLSNVIDMLASIESVIHRDVRKLYSDAKLPRFDVVSVRSGHSISLEYSSSRPFADLAHGLIDGALRYYGQTSNAVVSREDLRADGTHSRFHVTLSES